MLLEVAQLQVMAGMEQPILFQEHPLLMLAVAAVRVAQAAQVVLVVEVMEPMAPQVLLEPQIQAAAAGLEILRAVRVVQESS